MRVSKSSLMRAEMTHPLPIALRSGELVSIDRTPLATSVTSSPGEKNTLVLNPLARSSQPLALVFTMTVIPPIPIGTPSR